MLGKLKYYRQISTCYDKTAMNYVGMLCLALVFYGLGKRQQSLVHWNDKNSIKATNQDVIRLITLLNNPGQSGLNDPKHFEQVLIIPSRFGAFGFHTDFG